MHDKFLNAWRRTLMIPRHMVSLPIMEAAGKLARTPCTNATVVALT